MCGIAGIIQRDGRVDRADLQSMMDAQRHRGPDGEGLLVNGPVGLGHRRLSIIDLAGGAQPMETEDGTLHITYNGEIYNYRELKSELEGKGITFRTHSDTEVVLQAYRTWGAECLTRFRGMFAFAISDNARREVFLARDPFGIKPLVYRSDKHAFTFASEIKGLLAATAETPTGSLQALDYYLRFGYIPAPLTIYRDMHKLPPAHYLRIGYDGTAGEPVRYWDISFDASVQRSDTEWRERLEAVIKSSVKAHLVADVPFGVFLSGGNDSSLIALYMSQLMDVPLKGFTISFEESEYDELPYAREAADRLGIQLSSRVLRRSGYDELPEIMAHYDEPFADSSMIPTWHVSRFAREEFPMVLSGDGGDELFAGYKRYDWWMDSRDNYRGAAWRRLVQGKPGQAFHYMRRFYQDRGRGRLVDCMDYIDQVDARGRHALWKPERRAQLQEACAPFEAAHQRARKLKHLDYFQYLDIQTYLPGDILVKVDMASMACGLEVRPPLLDVEVAREAAGIPQHVKYDFNREVGQRGKLILKQLLASHFPAEFVYREKKGFSIPRDLGFLPGGFLRELFEDTLADSSNRLGEVLEQKQVYHLLETHTSSRDNSTALWSLLILALWMQRHARVSF